jgi:hypothetical protein
MMGILGRGDVAMNLVGLILIAALSGGIVAVSLRLRASASSARMWIESDRLPEEDWQQPTQSARSRGVTWLQDPFGLKGESGLYRAVKDQIGS